MITLFYVGLLALLYFRISLDTINARLRHKVLLGTGEHNEIADVVSAHANFSAYVPILLLMLYGIEQSSILWPIAIHAFGVVIVVGRVLHYYGIVGQTTPTRLRVFGMYCTLWPLLLLAIMCLIIAVWHWL